MEEIQIDSSINIKISQDDKKILKIISALRGKTQQDLTREIIQDWVKSQNIEQLKIN